MVGQEIYQDIHSNNNSSSCQALRLWNATHPHRDIPIPGGGTRLRRRPLWWITARSLSSMHLIPVLEWKALHPLSTIKWRSLMDPKRNLRLMTGMIVRWSVFAFNRARWLYIENTNRVFLWYTHWNYIFIFDCFRAEYPYPWGHNGDFININSLLFRAEKWERKFEHPWNIFGRNWWE